MKTKFCNNRMIPQGSEVKKRNTAMKILFLPDWSKKNPYQKLLRDGIQNNGIEVGFGNFEESLLILFRTSQKHQDYKILHLHWINPYTQQLFWSKSLWKIRIRLLLSCLDIILVRCSGKKIIWTIHNTFSHESENITLERIFRKILYKLSNKVIVHAASAKDQIKQAYKLCNVRKMHIVPHGHFINYYPNTICRDEARKTLGISQYKKVVLFFGNLRAYKGVTNLIDCFNNNPQLKNINLLMVGKVVGFSPKEEPASLIKNQNIRTICRFVDDDEIQIFMNAADVCIFPFEKILTSGSVILAMSFAKPVIVPRQGCLVDLLDEHGAIFFSEKMSISEAIITSFHSNLRGMGDYNKKLISQYSWDASGKTLVSIYKDE